MPLVIYKPARTALVDGVLRPISDHEQWYVANESKDFNSKWGVIRKADLKPGKFLLGNEEFLIIPASYLDRAKHMRRGAQIITRKDVGFIIAYVGLTRDSVVVESGVGSAGATAFFSPIVKSVHGYEVSEEHLGVVQENIATLGLTNVTVTHGDFYDESIVQAHEADLVLLDLPEPWRAVPSALKAAKLGGYIVAYTPSIIQAQRFVNDLPQALLRERTLELIDRDWRIRGDAVRPVNTDIGHTGFLTIARRVL